VNGEQLGFGFNLNFGLSQPFLERAAAPASEVTHKPAPFDADKRTAAIDTALSIAQYRAMIEEHHAAMVAGNEKIALAIRKDAHELAAEMNGGTTLGIMGGEGSPCDVLERATAAPAGTVPLWGQTGDYIIDVDGMRVRIEQDGMFGIGCSSLFWTPFAVHAVDYDKPFVSNTGYRSFCGLLGEPQAGFTPDTFARELLRAHIKKEMKGKLERIDAKYQERLRERSAAA
jgi:hypothetical protein